MARTVAGSIVYDLLMRTASLETDVARAQKIIEKLNKEMNKTPSSKTINVSTKFDENTKKILSGNLNKGFGQLGFLSGSKGFFGALSLGFGTAEIIDYADEATKLNGILKNVTSENIKYSKSQEDVYRISQIAQAGIKDIGVSYARTANALADLGATQQQISDITETLSLALKVNGATAAETSSVLIQMSQAFGKGKLDGDEFRTAMEASPNVMRRLAESIGVPFGSLKDLAAQGKITSDVLMKAFSDPEYLNSLRKQAEEMRTIKGSFVEIRNEIIKTVDFYKNSVVGDVFSFAGESLVLLTKTILGGFRGDFSGVISESIASEVVSSVGQIRELNKELVETQNNLRIMKNSPVVNQESIDEAIKKISIIKNQIFALSNSKGFVELDVKLVDKGLISSSSVSSQIQRDEKELEKLRSSLSSTPPSLLNLEKRSNLKNQISALENLISAEKNQLQTIKSAEDSLKRTAKEKKEKETLGKILTDPNFLDSKERIKQEIEKVKNDFEEQTKDFDKSSELYVKAKNLVDAKVVELEKGLSTKNKKGKSEAQKQAEDAKKFIDSLREQNATIGLTESQTILYEASLKKLTATQLQEVNLLALSIEEGKRKEELMKMGKDLTEQMLAPQQKLSKEYKNLFDLLSSGAISSETYTKAVYENLKAYRETIPELQKAKELTEQFRTPQEILNQALSVYINLLNEGYISQSVYSRAVQDSLKSFRETDPEMKKMIENQQELNQIISNTPTEKLEEQRRLIKALYDEFYGRYEDPRFKEAIDVVLGRSSEMTEKVGSDTLTIEAMFKRAAENAQDAFADFLFEPFKDGMDGMLSSFITVMRRMASEALAAEIFKKILGSFNGGSGDGGNIFSAIGGAVKNIFGGFFADGGSPPINKISVVGERGPEFFVPRTAGTVIPNNLMNNSQSNQQPNIVLKSINVLDPSLVGQYLSTSQGEKVIMNVIQRNRSSLGL